MTDFKPRLLASVRTLLAVLLLGLWVAGPGATADIRMVSIDRPTVHMRAGPGTSYDVLWNLARGYPLQVIGRDRGWLKVRDFEDDVSWVLARLTGRKPHLVVKAEVLNIRSRPDTDARIVGRATYGEVLRTQQHKGSWVRVQRQPDGPTGWVARRLTWGW